MKRTPKYSSPRSDRYDSPRTSAPPSFLSKLNFATIALFGVIFLMGMGVGIGFSSTASFTPENVASREVIDRSAPNAEMCIQFGASAMVADLRVFLTLNPFNVFVTQPVMQPGCVLRRNNWSILEQQKLVSSEEVNACKNRMNTFGFTGPLEGNPQINCIYQNSAAGNLFLNQPAGTSGLPESTKF